MLGITGAGQLSLRNEYDASVQIGGTAYSRLTLSITFRDHLRRHRSSTAGS